MQNILADKNVQKSIGSLLYDQLRLRISIAVFFDILKIIGVRSLIVSSFSIFFILSYLKVTYFNQSSDYKRKFNNFGSPSFE